MTEKKPLTEKDVYDVKPTPFDNAQSYVMVRDSKGKYLHKSDVLSALAGLREEILEYACCDSDYPCNENIVKEIFDKWFSVGVGSQPVHPCGSNSVRVGGCRCKDCFNQPEKEVRK